LQNYKALATKYGLNADDFILKLRQPEWKEKTYAQFTQADKLGVTGYPALTLKRNGTEQIVVSGFESFKNILKMYPFKK
jgi:protein-disulfide isomerase-like protein with CxxC motif